MTRHQMLEAMRRADRAGMPGLVRYWSVRLRAEAERPRPEVEGQAG